MQREFDDYLGELDYAISKRKKLSIIGVPITNYLVILATKKEDDADDIAKKMINGFGKTLV